jgi:PAS domain S-box-containing protein
VFSEEVRYPSWAWFGPALLSGIFLVGLGILLYFLQVRMTDENIRALDADAVSAREALQARLDADRNFLLSLADDFSRDALDEVSFQGRVARYTLDHPEILSVRWLSPDLNIHRQAPAGATGKVVGIPVTGGESLRAIRLAAAGKRWLWTRPFTSAGGRVSIELWSSVFREGRLAGLFGATFSFEEILRVSAPAPLALDYRLALEAGLGGIVAALPAVERVDPNLSRRVPLDPPGYGVSLLMQRYGSRFWGWGMSALAVACVALAVGMGFGMWLLGRTIGAGRRAEAALRAGNEALGALMEASPLASIVLDGDGRVALWNKAAQSLFGWAPEEVVGRPNPIVPPDRQDEFHRLLARAVAGGFEAVETRRIRKDGTPVEVRISAAPLRDPSGGTRFVIDVLVDISRERAIEERLREAEKIEAVGRLAGGVAHDFNNLLTAILGYSDLLMHRLPEGDRMRREIEEIHKAGERAAVLTRQLLAFGRKQVLQPRRIDLNAVVVGMRPMLSRLVGEGIRLEIVPAPAPVPIDADPDQIGQAVANLVINAREAMPGGGWLLIAVSAAPGGRHVLLSVRDTGKGIDEETRAHLFEPFYTTKEGGKGAGLGLPTVYGIVAQSGGSIEVESAVGHGTEFRISLPAAGEAPAATREKTAVPEASTSAGVETVLVVEDEPVIRRLVASILERTGYTVLEAGDGVEALQVASGHAGPIDLLLTDVVMPRMGGKELADRLAAQRPRMKVLFMSGYPDDALGADGVLPEHVSFLAKPFMPNAVAHKVRELLDGREKKGD